MSRAPKAKQLTYRLLLLVPILAFGVLAIVGTGGGGGSGGSSGSGSAAVPRHIITDITWAPASTIVRKASGSDN